MLNLPVCAWVGDCGLVHLDVIEIQELLPGELNAVVGDDGVWDPKMEILSCDDGVWDPKMEILSWTKFTACLDLILARVLASIQLVNLSIATSRWVKPSGAFLKGPKRSRPHVANNHVMWIVWSS
jgi:hypothetical protein